MKSRPSNFRTSLGVLSLCALTTLTLGAGAVQADNGSCLLSRGSLAPQALAGTPAPTPPATPQFQAQLQLLEQGLREGRITPYEAGRLLRQQWEMEQFRAQLQQGFLAATPTARNEGCGLGGDLGASLGDMAKNGMQTAGSLMRSLMREGERLLREQPEAAQDPL